MKESYNNIGDIIERVESEDYFGYAKWPFPCHIDEEMSKIVNIFLSSGQTERESIFEIKKKPFLFLAFSRRMAILGVREQSEQRLFEGLIAHVIEDFRYDYRENLMELSLLYHSATKIGSNPVELFERAATFATPETAKHITSFAHRTPELKSIATMGFKEIMTPDGFSYESTGWS